MCEYDDLREYKLADVLYPRGILIKAEVMKDERIKIAAFENSIPEFKRFNIVENEVRNVI